MDGEGVRMGDLDIFPAQEEKVVLLNESLTAAKTMIKEGRSMEDVAILLSTILTAVHPFADGNGRTAKFILALLLKGYDPSLVYEILVSEGTSNLVAGHLFENLALGVIELEFVPTEQYPTFDDTYFQSNEYNARRVRVMIDIILHNEKPEYKGFALDYPDCTGLQNYKDELRNFGVDKDIFNKLFN